MSKKWSDFANSSAYQDLSDDEKKSAQNYYYENIIYPDVAGTPQAKSAREQFLKEANPTIVDKALDLGGRAISGMANVAKRGINAIPSALEGVNFDPSATEQVKAMQASKAAQPSPREKADPLEGSVMQGMDGAPATAPTAEAATAYANVMQPQADPNAPIDPSLKNITAMKPEGFMEISGNALARTVKSSHAMNKAIVGLGLDLIGADNAAKSMLQSAKTTQDENALYPAQIQDFTHIKSWGDVPVYALEGILENSAMLAQSVLSGGVGAGIAKGLGKEAIEGMLKEQAKKEIAKRIAIGSAVGASISSIGMESGSIYSDIYNETGEMRPAVALAFGSVAGALDAIPAAHAVRTALGGKLAGEVSKTLLKRYGAEGLKQIAEEGGTEFLQTWVEKGAVAYVDGKPFLNEKNLIESVDAMLKGGAAGAGTHIAMQGANDLMGGNAVDPQALAAENAKQSALSAWGKLRALKSDELQQAIVSTPQGTPESMAVQAEVERRANQGTLARAAEAGLREEDKQNAAIDATELYGADPTLSAIQGGINAGSADENSNVGVDATSTRQSSDNAQGSVVSGTDGLVQPTAATPDADIRQDQPLPPAASGINAVIPQELKADTSIADRPFSTATDDFLPKMRGMTTDLKVIEQIDAELNFRGIGTGATTLSDNKQAETPPQAITGESLSGVTDNKVVEAVTPSGAMNDSWQKEFDRAKSTNDFGALNTLHNKVKVALNGLAQGNGAETVKQFEQFKVQIEQYAEEVKSKKAAETTATEIADSESKAGDLSQLKAETAPEAAPEVASVSTPDNAHIAYVGITPKASEPVTIKGGIIHVGGSPALNYDTGEEIKAGGSSFAEVKKALVDAGVLSTKQKVFNPSNFSKDLKNAKAGGTTTDNVPTTPDQVDTKQTEADNSPDQAEDAGTNEGDTNSITANEQGTETQDEANGEGESKAAVTSLPAPQDGWESNLIKTRLYAKRLMDAGVMGKQYGMIQSVWSDHEKLLAKVYQAIDSYSATPDKGTSIEALKSLREKLSADLQAQGHVTDARIEDRLKQTNDAITAHEGTAETKVEPIVTPPENKEERAKKVTAHKREFERALFNAAIGFELGEAKNQVAFAVQHNGKIQAAIEEMRKDATPEQLSALDLLVKDGKPNLSLAFWKNVFKEAQTAAGVDTSKKSKLQNTGIELRRWYELNKSNVGKAKDWKAIDKATTRATAFNPAIAENADSNLQAYIDLFRTAAIQSFGDYMGTGSRFNTWGKVSKGIIQSINNFLNGDSYTSELGRDATSEERITLIKKHAGDYLDEINKLNEALSGASTVKEFSDKLEAHMQSKNLSVLPDWIVMTDRTIKDGADIYYKYNFKANPETAPAEHKYFGMQATRENTPEQAKKRALDSLNNRIADAELSKVFNPKLGVTGWYDSGRNKQILEGQAGKPNSGKKLTLMRPRLDKITRENRKDVRKGNVTPTEIKQEFGLADVVFGQYVNAVQDQKHLNYAYDALSDMAKIMGLPNIAMGLGGKLHLAIGALGSGKAAAHYADNQPDGKGGTVHVMNFTNTRGDGTVSHEWTHALDYHLKHYDPQGYKLLNLVRRDLSKFHNIELVKNEAKKFIFGGTFYPHMKKESKQVQAIYHIKSRAGGKADTTAYQQNANDLGEDYWGNEREILARAGEAYIYDQLLADKSTSDYLVTDWVADGKVTKQNYRGTPYPEAEERTRFNALFKVFFDSLEATKDGVKVNAEKFNKAYVDPSVQFELDKKDLIDNMPRYIEDWKLERAEKKAQRDTISDEDQQRIDEQNRIAQAAEQAAIDKAVQDALNPNNQTGALSDDDLSALFDEAAAELNEAAAEQPNVVVGEPQVSKPEPTQAEQLAKMRADIKPANLMGNKQQKSTETKNAETAAQLSLKAAKLGVKGIDEALSGLVNLFGGNDKGRLNSFPSGFDEEAYKKAKPHFEASLKAFTEAGKTLKDLFKFLIENLGLGVKPYAIQFAKELQLGAQLSNDQKENQNESTSGDSNGDGSNEEPRSDLVSGSEGNESANGDSGIESDRNDGADLGNDGGMDGGESKSDTTTNEGGTEQGNGAGDSNLDEVSADRGNNRLGKNFVIPQGGLKREGSWKDTASRNLDIIELVKKLDEEKRQATPQEQTLLSKYTGFGASDIRNVLFSTNTFTGGIYRPSWVRSDWQTEAKRASELLTPDELKSIVRTTQYAHFTSEAMTRGIWDGLTRMGFTGGKVLEAGMGSGNFAGTMPANVSKLSKYTGIEYDQLTASIAKQLYPESNIMQADYTETKLPNGFFDLTIGNPPFSQTRVTNDPAYRKQSFALHDYFIAKSLDKVRDGGLAVFVTSKGTMDALNDRARKYIAERADLVGAIRMPQTAFKENAGTETITDVLILRKRGKDEVAGGASWMGHKEVLLKDPSYGTEKSMLINEYFVDHPEMVLGDGALKWGQHGQEYTVNARAGSDIETDFAKAILNLPENIYSTTKADAETTTKAVAERDFNPTNKKEGGLYVDPKGNLMMVDSGSGIAATEIVKLDGKAEAYLKDYVKLRDALKQTRYDQWNDGDWESSLKALNKEYAAFVKKNGNIKDYTSSFVSEEDDDGVVSKVERRRYKHWNKIKNDVEGTLVWALETIDEKGNIQKAKPLLGRTVKKPLVAKIETIQDALAVSLDNGGILNLDKVAELFGTAKDKVIAELGDLIYETPSSEWQLRDEYLSGKVIDKLEEAEAAAKMDHRFDRNVKALLAVQPKLLSADGITANLGANWIPSDYLESFVDEVMEERLSIKYSEATSTWKVEGNGSRNYQRSRTSDWGTSDRSPAELLGQVLNSKTLDVKRTDPDTKKTSLDPVATALVNDIAKKMREKFKSWLWTDAKRAENLSAMYNRKFNNIVGRTFDGSHLTLSGVATDFKPHPHQLRAIWRVVQTGNTYLDHAVGAGKTFEMIASGMEQRRLGMIRRPMYVVPNHMLEQFASEFMEFYPTASIMVADKENFHADVRKRFMAQAAMNDPDAIIITHSSFGRIGLNAENYNKIVEEQIDELRVKLEEVKGDGDRVSIKKLEQQVEALEKKLKGKLDADGKDAGVTFEDIGVDFLYVDEAHEFRKLDFATNKTKVKGIDPNGSAKAMDLYTKIRYLSSINPTRSHAFASGTPVTNTMGELYTVMKYFARDELEATGLLDFDAWSTMFGDVVAEYEPNAAGRYELVERFSKFQNVPELMKRIRSFMDVLTSNDLGTLVKRPTIVGGSRKIVITPMPNDLRKYMDEDLMPRITTSKAWKPSPDQPNNPDPIIAIISDARLANIDMRFIDPQADNDPDSKLNRMIDGIIETHNRLKDKEFINKDTGKKEAINGATQIVFANVGFGDQVAKNRGFSAKEWLNKRLKEAGIKSSEIAWMGEYDTAVKKEAMFMQMRSGEKKILIGSPKNMGTGVNVQSRLGALHYLDAPWFPSDLEQPEGRIYRQGNRNEMIEMYAYATKGSYDSSMWQAVARKGRFIEQAFNGDDSVRTLEDVSESSNYQMAAALASGDDRVVKLAGLEADVEKYGRLKNAHAVTQRELRTKQVVTDAKIREIKTQLENIAEAEKLVGDGLRGDVALNVGKKDITDKAEAGKALIDKYDEIAKTHTKVGDTAHIATVAGKFKLYLDVGFISPNLMLHLTDKLKIRMDDGKSLEGKDPAGLMTRIINQINRVSQMRYASETALEQAMREKDMIESKIGAPYEYEQELNEKIAEAANLKEELANTGNDVAAELQAVVAKADEAVSGSLAYAPTYAFATRIAGKNRIVEAAKVDMSKYIAADPQFESIELYKHYDKESKDYVITEESTGMSVMRHADELKAESEALSRILTMGYEAFNAAKSKQPTTNIAPMPWDAYQNGDTHFIIGKNKAGNGLSTAAVENMVSIASDGWKKAPSITVIQDMQDPKVPASVSKLHSDMRAGGSTGNPIGFISKGKVYVLSSMVGSQADINEVVLHEVFGHYGLRGNFGSALDPLLEQIAIVKGKEVRAKALSYGLDYNKREDRLHAAEEVLAEMAQTNPELGFVKRAIALIRTWLRKNVAQFKSLKITDDEIINNILVPARNYVKNYVRNRNTDPLGFGTLKPIGKKADGKVSFALQPSNSTQATVSEGGLFDKVLQVAGGKALAKYITQPLYNKAAQLIDSKYLLGSNAGKVIKAGMIADYGLDEQYLDRRDEIEARMNAHLRKSKHLIKSIAGLSRQESRIAYQWLQEKPDTAEEAMLMGQLPAESIAFLNQIKTMIEDLSQEAIALGQLKPEQYERNKFAYLHRSYAKYEIQDEENKSFGASTRRRVMGDQYKGRGLQFVVDVDRLDTGGDSNPIVKGDKYVRLESRNAEGKLTKRVWWNAGVPVPPMYRDMEADTVQWEVRNDHQGKVTLWRDFTKEERERMGELDEAKFAVATTVSKMAHDIEMGKFFEFVNGEYAQDEAPDGANVVDNAGESAWSKGNLIDALAENAWVKVPDTKVQGTDVAKYGAIAGKYVSGAIWNDIRQIMNTPSVPQWYSTIMRFWKISKTALSPAVHLNNIMANMVMADMHDVRAKHMVKAIEVLWKARKDPEAQKFIERFEDSGAITGTYVHAELKDDMMKPLLEELRREIAGSQSSMQQMHTIANALSVMYHEYHNKGIRKGMSMMATTKAGKLATKIPEVMIETYQNEDVIFRLGAFIKGLEEGKTDREAGKIARKAFLDYRINAPWITALRQTVLPFVAFTYRMVPMYVEAIRDKPWKLAKYMIVANTLAAIGMAMAGIDDKDDDEIQKLLPDDRKGLTPYFTQRQIPVGKDKNGNIVYLDTTRWIPLGDIFELQGDSSNTLPIAGFASPSGIFMIAGDVMWNRSRFNGRDVWQETDTTSEAAGKVLDQIYKGMMPNNPLLPRTYAYDKIANSLSGKTDMMGREYSTGQAIASAFGVKVSTYDKKQLNYNKMMDLQASKKEIQGNMRRISIDYARKGITKQEHKDRMEAQRDKLKAIVEEARGSK